MPEVIYVTEKDVENEKRGLCEPSEDDGEEDIPEDDKTIKVFFNKDQWIKTVSAFRDEIAKVNPSYNFTVEKLLIIQPDWIRNGLESYSISYGGQNGVTTTVVIGTRKKQKERLDNLNRMLMTYYGKMSRPSMPKPSANRISINVGMNAFA